MCKFYPKQLTSDSLLVAVRFIVSIARPVVHHFINLLIRSSFRCDALASSLSSNAYQTYCCSLAYQTPGAAI